MAKKRPGWLARQGVHDIADFAAALALIGLGLMVFGAGLKCMVGAFK